MQQVYIPFLGYLILQLFVMGVGLCLIRGQENNGNVLLKSWIFGQMLLFAILQIMAVSFILLHWSFNALFWSYLATGAVLFFCGIFRIKKVTGKKTAEHRRQTWLSILLLVLGILIILYQSGSYLVGMHLDKDDARWMAQANDALVYGDMMTRDPDTGEYVGTFYYVKDTTSPWPIMLAVVTRLLNTRTTIFAHTIYAPVQLIMMYGIYWLIGTELFKKAEARTGFLLFVAVINLFFGGTLFSQSVFSLVRIWQGKATVAGIMIPLLLYLFICLNNCHETENWVKVLIVGCAGCLMSGMGIIFSVIMIGVFGAYYILAYQKWKHIPFYLFAMIPSIVFALVNRSL